MPGEALYGVKLAVEQVMLQFSFTSLAKAETYAKLADRRVNEIVYLAERGDVPQIAIDKIKYDTQGEHIKEKIRGISQEVAFPMNANLLNYSLALEKIWELINVANKYVEETKPWNLAKENKTDELKAFIRLLVDVIRVTARQINPFMPQTAESITEQIGQDKISKGKPLFPRIDLKSNI